jgi:hypothetical protein
MRGKLEEVAVEKTKHGEKTNKLEKPSVGKTNNEVACNDGKPQWSASVKKKKIVQARSTSSIDKLDPQAQTTRSTAVDCLHHHTIALWCSITMPPAFTITTTTKTFRKTRQRRRRGRA